MTEAPKKPGFFGRLFGRASKHDETAVLSQEPSSPPAAELPLPVAPVQAEAAAQPPPSPLTAPAGVPPAPVPNDVAPPVGWMQRLTSGLSRTSSKLSDGIAGVFTRRKLDAGTLDELEDLLLQADLGVETSGKITAALTKGRYDKGISADEVRAVLAREIATILAPVAKPLELDDSRKPHVILVVGVNGSGKTTTIGKLAAWAARDGKRVMLAAGDTFRAAAIDQLQIWGNRTGAPVVARPVGSDAAGLAFDALTAAREGNYDVLVMDTAGRLQNKQGLMQELEKIVRVMKKVDPSAPHDVVLVLDATTGQNALNQVEVFRNISGVSGLIMTKLDGTARGGILVAIAARFGLPVHAIGVGEGIDDLQAFDADEFARAIALV
jgi:fused signal recognition particle receptor